MAFYNITDSYVGNIEENEPDIVNPDDLKPGDIIGRYAEITMNLQYDYESYKISADDVVLLVFAASIQPDKKFKVYWMEGTRHDIYHCAKNGYKVRGEQLARALFPMLNDYLFISN